MTQHSKFGAKFMARCLQEERLWRGRDLQVRILVEEVTEITDSLIDGASSTVILLCSRVKAGLICLVIDDQARQAPNSADLKILN